MPACARDDFLVCVEIELERREELSERRGAHVRGRRARGRHEPVRVKGLQLDRTGTGLRGAVHELERPLDGSAMVQPDLGDDEHRGVQPDPAATYLTQHGPSLD